MKVIGLTGGSGSGKGFAASLFESRFGIRSVDCDKVARAVCAKGQKCLDELVEAFGESILTDDGEYNRPVMAGIVFSDPEKLALLNRISHKHILASVRETVEEARERGDRAILIDAPQLFESGFDRECDLIVSVMADREDRIERILKRDGITRENAEKRLASQKSDEFYLANSDFIVYNNKECTREAICAQIGRFLDGAGI